MTTANLVRARHKARPAAGVPLGRAIPPHRFRTSTPDPTPLAPGQERPVRPGWLNQCIHCWGWYDDPRHITVTYDGPQTGATVVEPTDANGAQGVLERGAPAAPAREYPRPAAVPHP